MMIFKLIFLSPEPQVSPHSEIFHSIRCPESFTRVLYSTFTPSIRFFYTKFNIKRKIQFRKS